MISWICFFFYRFVFVPGVLLLLRLCKPLLPEKLKVMLTERESPNWPQLSARPIWIHAASGEIEYAKSILRSIKEKWPQRVILVTYFSPSAKKLIQSMGTVDAIVPLPWDEKKKVAQFLAHFKPELCLIARTDVWPEFAYQTNLANIPSILFAATFATESKRQGLFSSPLTRFAFDQLKVINCVSEEDAAEIHRLKTRTPVKVAGDTRYDQVVWRLHNPLPFQASLAPAVHPVLVAGSTWPQDEAMLLPGLSEFIKAGGKVVIAPHEIALERIQRLVTRLKKMDFKVFLYSSGTIWQNEDVLVVDQMGSLQEIYGWGDIAFVGGSFKDKVHSVMEPLAAGLPVLVGPSHANNREALHFQHVMIERMNAVEVVRDSEDIQLALSRFSARRKEWEEIRRKLNAKVHVKAGATAALFEQIVMLLSDPS